MLLSEINATVMPPCTHVRSQYTTVQHVMIQWNLPVCSVSSSKGIVDVDVTQLGEGGTEAIHSLLTCFNLVTERRNATLKPAPPP